MWPGSPLTSADVHCWQHLQIMPCGSVRNVIRSNQNEMQCVVMLAEPHVEHERPTRST